MRPIGFKSLSTKSSIMEVDWIATDGNAYIDTQWIPPNKIGMLVNYAVSSFSTRMAICGTFNVHSTIDLTGACVFFGSSFADRRTCFKTYVGSYGYWDGTANSSNTYWDGNFHEYYIKYSTAIPASLNYRSTMIIDNVDFSIAASIQNTSTNSAEHPLFIFAGNYNGTQKLYQVPASSNVKLNRLAFASSDDFENSLIHDYRAAKNGSNYGLYDLVTKQFLNGIDGKILGPDKSS